MDVNAGPGSLADILSRIGAGIAPNTGPMAPAMPAAPTGVDQSERLRREAEAELGRYRGYAGQLASLPPPNLTPVMDTGSTVGLGIAGVLAALLGAPTRDIAEGMGAFVNAREKLAKGKDAYAQNGYEAKRQGLILQGQAALKGAQVAGNRADKLSKQEASAEALSERYAREDAARHDVALRAVQGRYQAARGPLEKRLAAAEWRRLDPSTAPTVEQVQKEALAMQAQELTRAREEWNHLVRSHHSPYGTVDSGTAEGLDRMRQALADRFGGRLDMFDEVPTMERKLAKRVSETRAEIDGMFGTRRETFRECAAHLMARISMSQEHASTARHREGAKSMTASHFDSQARGFAKSLFGLAMGEKHLATRELNDLRGEPGRPAVAVPGSTDREARIRRILEEIGHLDQLAALAGSLSGETPVSSKVKGGGYLPVVPYVPKGGLPMVRPIGPHPKPKPRPQQ